MITNAFYFVKKHYAMEALINLTQEKYIEKKEFPDFSAGDTITVYYEIREGEKVRTQFFRGVVIQIKGQRLSKSFTIRKMSGTVGVERIFPLNLPTIQKIEINKKGKVRRSRIYYFKELRGKKARIKEK
jgi:large subunit ribosomal protein L19